MIKFFPFIPLILLSCNTNKISKQITEVICEEYGMASGNYIRVTADSILIRTSTDGRNKIRIDVKNNERIWMNLLDLHEDIDFKNISCLVSPTNARAIDGAYYSHIEISTKSMKFTSSDFDGGTPPKELKELYDYMTTRIEDSLVRSFSVVK